MIRTFFLILHPSAFILFFCYDQVAFAQPQGHFHRLGESAADLRAGHQAVDDDFDVVPHLAVQPQVVGQADDAAIDAGTDKPLFQQVLEEVAIFAFLTAHRTARAPGTACRGPAARSDR